MIRDGYLRGVDLTVRLSASEGVETHHFEGGFHLVQPNAAQWVAGGRFLPRQR